MERRNIERERGKAVRRKLGKNPLKVCSEKKENVFRFGDVPLRFVVGTLLWGTRRFGMRDLDFTCLERSIIYRNSFPGCLTKRWSLIVTDN